ncbi:hypothetical protein [Hathewaya massiliensis]|uniref:hypothetical protein n=1 Tax=Hathewaya massiliensis TaxID=1964382 RepID=UPI0011572F20|nr:hypothetical protein [Hathewaya massiliensis]
MSILAISTQYKQRPSEIMGLTNDYEAFCFDETCIYIINEISKEDAKEPRWIEESKESHKDKSQNSNTIEWMMKHSKPL